MLGTVLNQRFSLDKELGRGGMGAVYRATDQLLDRSVAIKVLKELSGEEVGRKIRLEAQILARLLHENIVRLYDFGIADGTYYLVMEEVDGTSLQKRWKKISLVERLHILAQVASALDYAHHQGVIHRDVKPANILLTSTDQAKLSDFGLSLMAQDTQESGITRGTPQFMSPEQARGRRLDHRSDLYALGIILYECCTGNTPFQGPLTSVMSQHVRAAPEPPRARNPELSSELEALILQLLAKKPEDRPGSGQAVAHELREMLQGDRWLAPSVGKPRPQVAEPAAPPVSVTAEPISEPASAVSEPASADSVPALLPTAALVSPAPSATTVPQPGFVTRLPDAAPSLVRLMIEAVEADPIVLSPDDRYLCGNYLAFLLGGARRRGFFGRRPIDHRNADRARLLLAMTYVMVTGTTDGSITLAADLLETQPDVRAALSPIVVMKYLDSRDTEPKRKRFRQSRKKLKEASPYAQKHMLDARGSLNPGLIPQTFDDMRKLATVRTEVDDELVQRWNRLAEVWRGNFVFRESVLRYATLRADRDPASFGLWPEVVYPLIERARWQRQSRSRLEALWDSLRSHLHLPAAGLRLDHAFEDAVPVQVVEKLDLAIAEFVDEPQIDEPAETIDRDAERLSLGSGIDETSIQELTSEGAAAPRGLIRLTSPDPVRFSLGDLGALYREGVNAIKTPGSKVVHRPVPVGPYRLAVIPTIRGRSAGTVAIQGMKNKQIELLTPSLRVTGTASMPTIAVWVYRNQSLVISYIDFKHIERYILWDAGTSQQTNFTDAGTMNTTLLSIGLEAPDQLDRALTNLFRPKNPV